jgi:hypothetical protein
MQEKERDRARGRKYRAARTVEEKERDIAYSRKYYRDHRRDGDALRRYKLARAGRLKMAALVAYGGPKCTCCGETLFEGLCIDHVNGDGAKQRRETGTYGGDGFYLWLKRMGYPPGFQVLCHTCNFAKGNGDHCPHQDLTIAWG